MVSIIPKEDIKVNNNSIEINSHIKESANINKLLVESGIMVNAIYPNLDSLEEYFMKRIGE